MSLNADLNTNLDASSLVSGFLGTLSTHANGLNAISSPADASSLSGATSAGGSFLPAPLLQSITQFAGVALPTAAIPATLTRIESTLTSLEQLTTRDVGADVEALAQQLITELQNANDQGIPGILLKVSQILQSSPTGSAVTQILGTLTSGIQNLGIPPQILGILPAFANTARTLAGLMVYETVLAEGEQLTRFAANQFSAAIAQQMAASVQSQLEPLPARLNAVDPNDADAVGRLTAALETAAASLAALGDYAARGMGFGEATLVHFDVGRAQTEIAAAGELLKSPDLSALQQLIAYLAQLAQPVTDLMDPQDAAARGIGDVLNLAEAQVAQGADAIRNLNVDIIAQPLADGITAITRPLTTFTDLVSSLVTEVRSALDQVRAAIAALPVGAIAQAIHDILDPVTQALQFLQHLVDDIKAALQAAAQAAITALGQVEGAVDQFKQQIEGLFQQAKQFIDGLHLDQIASTIGDKIQEFVALLQKAQMKPYFDAAAGAIGTAGDVISKIPFSLVPDSMKPDVDAALQPVRDVDPDEVETEIETLLAIGPDGKFELRSDLEAALAEVQAKFDEVMQTLEDHHPRQYLQQIDQELSALAAKIQSLAPQLTLEPVQNAINQLKSALNGFDLHKELQPVQDVFDHAIAALDEYSPAKLLAPIEARVAAVRQKIQDTIRIDDWKPTIDSMQAAVLAQLSVLDETVIQAAIKSALEQLQNEIGSLPSFNFGSWLGSIITGLMRGANMRLSGSSIESVLAWLGGGTSASHALSQRASNIGAALAATRQSVESFDPAAQSALVTAANSVTSAANTLAGKLADGSDARIRLQAAIVRLDASDLLSSLASNRTRYLALIVTAASLGDTLARTGMSEADVAVTQLRAAFAPLAPLVAKLRQLASYLGIQGTQSGFQAVMEAIFQVATPDRIAALPTPLFAALRDRLNTLLNDILAPIRAAIDELKTLIGLIDLQPIIDSINSIFNDVKTQILAFSPNVLLHDQLQAFDSLKADLLSFDPLAAILAILNNLRDTAARVIGKLSAEKILATPLAIYDEILHAFSQINIETLLAPVLDALDNIAQQVDQGLDETVTAFRHLQDSLPPPGGGSSASVSVGA